MKSESATAIIRVPDYLRGKEIEKFLQDQFAERPPDENVLSLRGLSDKMSPQAVARLALSANKNVSFVEQDTH